MSLASPYINSPYFYRLKHEQPPGGSDCPPPVPPDAHPRSRSNSHPHPPLAQTENQLPQRPHIRFADEGDSIIARRVLLDYLHRQASEESIGEPQDPVPATLEEELADKLRIGSSENSGEDGDDEEDEDDEGDLLGSCSCTTTESSWSSESDDHHRHPLFARRRKPPELPFITDYEIDSRFLPPSLADDAGVGTGDHDNDGNGYRPPCGHRRCRRVAPGPDGVYRGEYIGTEDKRPGNDSAERDRKENVGQSSEVNSRPGKHPSKRLPDTIVEGTPPSDQEGLIRAPSGRGTIVYVPTAFKELYITLGVTSLRQLTKKGYQRRFSKRNMAALKYDNETIREFMNIGQRYRLPRQLFRSNAWQTIPILEDKECFNDRAHRDRFTYENDHYNSTDEPILGNKYNLERTIGSGTFGTVFAARDFKNHCIYAVKIFRARRNCEAAARNEIRVLKTLAGNDPRYENVPYDYFTWHRHVCLVTRLYDENTHNFMKENSFCPFPNSHIQAFAWQLFNSVAYMHDLGIIHTDIKPQNIVLDDCAYLNFDKYGVERLASICVGSDILGPSKRKILRNTRIHLVDLSSAQFDDQRRSRIISTKFYRAPEVLLDIGYSYPADIWSIGCTLLEFYTGQLVFSSREEIDHLAMVEVVCGRRIPQSMVARCPHCWFDRFDEDKLLFPSDGSTIDDKKRVASIKKLSDIVDSNSLFYDLLSQIFQIDPNKRITAKKALEHPLFQRVQFDDGVQATFHRYLQLQVEESRKNQSSRRVGKQKRSGQGEGARSPAPAGSGSDDGSWTEVEDIDDDDEDDDNDDPPPELIVEPGYSMQGRHRR